MTYYVTLILLELTQRMEELFQKAKNRVIIGFPAPLQKNIRLCENTVFAEEDGRDSSVYPAAKTDR